MADWDRCSFPAAWVNDPASAAAWKIRNLSQSSDTLFTPQKSLCGFSSFRRDGDVQMSGQVALGFERGHAAHAGGSDRLPEGIVGDIAGGEHALDIGRRRIRRGPEVAVR